MAYMGFKKLEGSLEGKVDNPGAVAASIGRKKYSGPAMAHASSLGRKKSHTAAKAYLQGLSGK